MKLKFLNLSLKTNTQITHSATMLRGFVASRFPEQPILHQHEGDGFVYLYPRVQYKIIDGVARIIGIDEGVEVLKGIYNKINKLKLGEAVYQVEEIELVDKEVEFGDNSSMQQYKFLTPWLALNQANYQNWLRLSFKEKKEKLKKTLVGNILSMAKGLEYVVTKTIKAEMDVKPVPTSLKGTPMLGFLGNFSVKFEIPDLWGLGKSVSRGFGTVCKQKT